MTKLISVAAALVAVLASSVFAAPKPNIVMIVADDLGYADIGVQAVSKDVRTPNIDSIANHGVRFTSGYVSCPVCSPSRAGFLTGRYQERFGHEANPLAKFDKVFGLPVDQITIAAELKRNGYVTGAFGKWHLGDAPRFRPQKRGFDEFYGFIGGMHSYTHSGTGIGQIRRGDTPIDEKEYLTEAITREVTSFIQRHKSEPFFAYVPFNAVHVPQEAPQKYQDRFADIKDTKRKLMLAMLSAEDDGVGKILATLRDNHLDENTLVIFFSDNGGPTHEDGSRNTPFRGFKGQVWEGGIRVPFMMRWTGHIIPAQVIDKPVISLDIFPTALAAANIAPRKKLKLDGVNLLPWLTSRQSGSPHDILFWRFKPAWAVREGNYKLVFALGETKTQLFDLATDLGEQTDLSAQKREVVQEMQRKFNSWNAQLMEPRWPGRQEGAQQDGKPIALGIPGVSGARDD